MIARIERTLIAALAVVCWPVGATAQVQTDVPPVVHGAKPVAVERISIHGASLEGNLEGDAVDREAEMMDAAFGILLEKLRDRRIGSRRLHELDLRVAEIDPRREVCVESG